MHPDVEVTELAPPPALSKSVIRSLAVSEDGVVALVDGVPYNHATGERLHQGGPLLGSAALTSKGLFLLTRQALSASIQDRRIVTGTSVVDPTIQAWASPGSDSVYLFGGQAAGGLYRLAADKLKRVLDSAEQVTALGVARGGILVARGRRIDEIAIESGEVRVTRIVEVPEQLSPILGLHDAERVLVIATEKAVLMFDGEAYLPLVVGVGGPLYPYRDGLLVHDCNSRKLLVIKGPMLAANRKQ